MTLLSPALSVPTRQVIVNGRAFERFTERGLEVARAVLRYDFGGDSGPIAADFQGKTGGYFALALDPSRDLPDVSGAGTVTLELELTLQDGSSHTLSTDVAEAALTPVTDSVSIDGSSHDIQVLPRPPISLTWQRDPVQPNLDILVLLNGDPAQPGAGLDVTVGALPAETTDGDGLARAGPLPLAASVLISVSDGTDTLEFTHHTDFTAALNRIQIAFQPDAD